MPFPHAPMSMVCAGETTASLTRPLNQADRSRSSNVPALFHTLAADSDEPASGVPIAVVGVPMAAAELADAVPAG